MKKWLIPALGLLIALLPFMGQAQNPAVPQVREQITLSFAPVVKQVAPAVVNIYARRKVQQLASPLFQDPFFRRFFEDAMPRGFSRERMENSLGSGVIVSPDGLIVTSNHVIAKADEIRVVLADKREFDATLVLADERTDLAVLRLDAKVNNLSFLTLKDSDDAQVGDLVLALGDPFGVGQTVTSGIISALARTTIGSSDLNYFIQTDAAINPGNSGGALVTMDGKLVGINSAIYSASGGNHGIGFAVPSNMVRTVLESVSQGKKTLVYAWTGIDSQPVTSELAASLNLTQLSGVLVSGVRPNSPGAAAGLRSGDVIIGVNGRSVDDPESYRYRIATLPIDSSALLDVVRKGEKLSMSMRLIAPPEDPPRQETLVAGENPLAGATIANMSPAVSEEVGLRGIEKGVVVMKVRPDSPASGIGIAPGDLIVGINEATMSSVNETLEAVKTPMRRWKLAIQRGGNVISVMVGG